MNALPNRLWRLDTQCPKIMYQRRQLSFNMVPQRERNNFHYNISDRMSITTSKNARESFRAREKKHTPLFTPFCGSLKNYRASNYGIQILTL